VIADLAGRLAIHLTRYAHRHGVHRYLATSCLHGDHAYCAGETGRVGAKAPARCKFCPDGAGSCVCPCHRIGVADHA